MENYVDIQTPWGIIKGRDGIDIIEINTTLPLKLELKVSINTKLCSINTVSQDFISAKLILNNILMIKIQNDEFIPNHKISSSIVEINNSELVLNNLELNNDAHHYIIRTYDYHIEVVCSTLSFDSKLFKI